MTQAHRNNVKSRAVVATQVSVCTKAWHAYPCTPLDTTLCPEQGHEKRLLSRLRTEAPRLGCDPLEHEDGDPAGFLPWERRLTEGVLTPGWEAGGWVAVPGSVWEEGESSDEAVFHQEGLNCGFGGQDTCSLDEAVLRRARASRCFGSLQPNSTQGLLGTNLQTGKAASDMPGAPKVHPQILPTLKPPPAC